MEITEKTMKKIMDIIEVDGFHVVSHGDNEAGMLDAEWEIKNKFYFDNKKELDEFKEELSKLFEGYVGDVAIETFKERQDKIEADIKMQYETHPVRYLIKDDGMSNMYMRPAPLTGMYSGDVGECIHFELPHWYSKDSKDVIPSTSELYWEIIKKALHDQQRTADVNGQHYFSAKRSINNLLQELNYGK